jgi:hypothetical protein
MRPPDAPKVEAVELEHAGDLLNLLRQMGSSSDVSPR